MWSVPCALGLRAGFEDLPHCGLLQIGDNEVPQVRAILMRYARRVSLRALDDAVNVQLDSHQQPDPPLI